MTNKQINEAIAEAIGGKRECDIGTLYSSPDGWTHNCPDFCNDLNAMHEAEKMLMDRRSLWETYRDILVYRLAHDHFAASALLRAGAFLQAIGKLKEVQP